MIAASLYILVCSSKNRLHRWFLRLREPRYAIAAIAGAVYLFSVVRLQLRQAGRGRRGRSGRASRPLTELFPGLALAAPVAAGGAVLLVAAAAWLFPGNGSLLAFTRPEVQFLFTAPVTRRQLILHRIVRSQLGVLFGSIVFSIFVPFGSNPQRVRTALSVWIVLFTARAYFSAVALSRAQLQASDPRRRLLARLPLAVIAGALAATAFALGAAFWGSPIVSVDDALGRIAALDDRGMPRVVLAPFIGLVAPFFAADWPEFARALPVALAILGICTAWVLLSDHAFEDVTTEIAERLKDQPRARKPSYRVRKALWTLAPTGRAEAAFVWKAMLQTFRIVERRVIIRMGIFVIWIAVAASTYGRGAAAALGAFATIAAVISTLLGPLILRMDLRQDLQHLELLKTWPMRAPQLVRGEMLWPAALLSSIACSATLVALYLSAAVFEGTSTMLRVSVGGAMLMVAPALIAAQLAIHNAAALVFPAWVTFGAWRARGVDAVGQRLFVVGGTLLLVTLAAAPGAIAGGLVFLAFSRLIGPAALLPAGAACAAVMGLEVLLVTEALGPAYERLDVLSVERGE